jgi:hypothetical protein
MPIEKTRKYYRVRIREPKGYIRYRTKPLPRGAKGVYGVRPSKGPRGGRTELQSVLIPKEQDHVRARRWATAKRSYRKRRI